MKNLAEFQALVNDVFALWQELSSQHYIPAAQSARQFIEKMTGRMFYKGWEFQHQRHGTVTPPNRAAQLQPHLAEAENEIVMRLVPFVMDPSQIRLEFAVEASERFLREMNVDLPAKRSGEAIRESAAETTSRSRHVANAIPQAASEESASEPGRDTPKVPVRPTPFTGGVMNFFKDRVQLCEVDICSGRRSENSRLVLDALQEKRNGIFVAYDGDELAAKTKLNSAKGIPGLIRDLRKRIRDALMAKANILCGESDVILSGGPGYRFSAKLSVQFTSEDCGSPVQGHTAANRGLNDPNQNPEMGEDDRNDPNVHDPDDPEAGDPDVLNSSRAGRRAWILDQLETGNRLLARDIIRQFKCSPATAKRDLQTLKDDELIDFDGAPSTGTYRLKKQTPQADA